MSSQAQALNLNKALRHLRRNPHLAPLIAKHGRPTFRPTHNTFRALTESIIYQQLSGKAAAAIFNHFLDIFPDRRFPAPARLLAVPLPRLRAAGLSTQKATYLLDLATKFCDGSLRPGNFGQMSDEEISQHLIQVKGIGQWTADMFLMFGLNRPDVLPVGDLGIRNGFKKLYGLRDLPTADEMITLAEPWRPHRTVASWYLWRVVEDK
ncbi:MAG: DNA-3-methyladenine glycosylase 2 family protein [Chloroflexi bacterium]|nr:DNA-3-methyladenine glycosylase 2 family protein [Chloroflexota bacterium]